MSVCVCVREHCVFTGVHVCLKSFVRWLPEGGAVEEGSAPLRGNRPRMLSKEQKLVNYSCSDSSPPPE